MTTKFVNTINEIVAAVGLTEQFQTEPEFYLKIVPECDAFEPLVIEAYSGASTGIGKRNISVAHYYEQNGDLVPDPDILMDELGRPIEISQWCGYRRIMDKRAEGQIYVNKSQMADVMSFMATWAGNLKNGVWMDIVKTGKRGKVYMKFEGETVEVVKGKKAATQATL